MCGIVGYVGPRPSQDILLAGLARLEYRGYDSAGIAVIDESGALGMRKKAGKLQALRDSLAEAALPDGTPASGTPAGRRTAVPPTRTRTRTSPTTTSSR